MPNMKRKTDDKPDGPQSAKKRTLSDDTVLARFRDGLFEPAELEQYTQSYASSGP
jgi:prolyl 3-hydroxylase /prolyl 3,4-dihydroxylase